MFECHLNMICEGTDEKVKARITLCVFLMLCWQLGSMQIKCTCNTNNPTYITLRFLIKYSGVILKCYVLFSQNVFGLLISNHVLVYPMQTVLRFLTQRNPKNVKCNKGLGNIVTHGRQDEKAKILFF